MKLTVIGLNYSPEPTGIAVYTSALATGLAESHPDWSVRVITGYPHYPQWRIYPGFEAVFRPETRRNLTVTRQRHYVPAAPKLINRLAMEIQFGMRSTFARWGKPNAVILVTPALFAAGIASIRARFARIPITIWVQDIYSLGVTESGTGGSIAGSIVSRLEKAILGSAESVVVIHDRFGRYLVEKLNVDPTKIEVVRNWSHIDEPSSRTRSEVRAERGWSPDDIVVLHAGNMGAKQGLENVVAAAAIASERHSRVRFVLMGDGNQRSLLESMPRSDRLDFVDPLPNREFSEALAAADILLVNERPGLTEMSVPSKLTSYFASGRPVVAATDVSSVTAEELATSQAGERVDADDPGALVDAAERIANNDDEARVLSDAGRAFSASLLSPEAAIAAFARIVRGRDAAVVDGTAAMSR